MWHSYVITRIFLAEFIDIFFQAYERLFGECAKKRRNKNSSPLPLKFFETKNLPFLVSFRNNSYERKKMFYGEKDRDL